MKSVWPFIKISDWPFLRSTVDMSGYLDWVLSVWVFRLSVLLCRLLSVRLLKYLFLLSKLSGWLFKLSSRSVKLWFRRGRKKGQREHKFRKSGIFRWWNFDLSGTSRKNVRQFCFTFPSFDILSWFREMDRLIDFEMSEIV